MKKRTGVIVGVLGVAVVAGFMYFPGQHNKNSKSQTLQTMMKDDVITMSPIMLTDIYSAQAQTQFMKACIVIKEIALSQVMLSK